MPRVLSHDKDGDGGIVDRRRYALEMLVEPGELEIVDDGRSGVFADSRDQRPPWDVKPGADHELLIGAGVVGSGGAAHLDEVFDGAGQKDVVPAGDMERGNGD